MRRVVVLLCGVALMVAACGDDGSTTGADGPDPWGRTFLSTGDPQVRLGFTDDRQVTATAECNHLMGAARIDENVLIVEQMGGTEMGCDPDRHAYDEWLAAFLTSSPALVLDGDTLTLTAGDDTLEFVDREVADPDRPLVGTRWVVDGVIDGETTSSFPRGAQEAFLEFTGAASTDSEVSGSTGCNSFSGPVTIGDGTIEVGQLVSTLRACEPGEAPYEEAVFAVLAGDVDYEIEAGSLRLTGAGGRGLTLRADG